jgi:hypothetical protein
VHPSYRPIRSEPAPWLTNAALQPRGSAAVLLLLSVIRSLANLNPRTTSLPSLILVIDSLGGIVNRAATPDDSEYAAKRLQAQPSSRVISFRQACCGDKSIDITLKRLPQWVMSGALAPGRNRASSSSFSQCRLLAADGGSPGSVHLANSTQSTEPAQIQAGDSAGGRFGQADSDGSELPTTGSH